MSTPSREHLFFNAFNQIQQIGSVRFRKLLNFFPNLETAWSAPEAELREAGLGEGVINEIQKARLKVDPEFEFSKLRDLGVELLTLREPGYPKLLKEIANPPATLYIRGRFFEPDETAIAIVGSRRVTMYGRQVAEDLTGDLVRAGLTIVSGLALGIDALVHRTTCENDGRTIAVLASGVETVYPASNRQIAEDLLAKGGAIVSEFPLGTPPLKHHFPIRNRIITGLCLGTVVVEAAADSGALITASAALEQNRQVYAVPGSIYNPQSVGPNNLLKMGAKPVTKASDILEDLNLAESARVLATEAIAPDNAEETALLKFLTREPQHIDQIVKSTGLSASTVAATLTIMEMKGKVRNLGGNQYILSR